MIFWPLLAFASFENDLKKVDALGDKADAILSSFGFENPQNQLPDQNEKFKNRQLFQIHGRINELKIEPGLLAFGSLFTRLVVGAEESPVIAEIKDSRLGILHGLRLMGRARQSATGGRVNIEFDRLLLKGGSSLRIIAEALDSSGALGLSGEVFSSKAVTLAGSMVGSFLSGYASSQQTTNAFGFSENKPAGRNALLQGVAQTAADQSKRLIDEATQEKPVIVIEQGTKVSILFKEEASL